MSHLDGDQRQWSDLPDLVLYTIAKFVPNPTDFFSLARVCVSWRSASRAAMTEFLASQPPWLCSVDYDRLYNLRDKQFYTKVSPFSHQKMWAVGFSSGHLILADSTSLHRLFLVNPFTGVVDYIFPKAPYAFSRAVLTASPVRSSNWKLIVYNSTSMQYCGPGDVEWGVYQFSSDDDGGGVGRVRNLALFDGRLFVLTVDGKLGTIDFTSYPKLNILESAELLPFGRFQGTWLGDCDGSLIAITCTYQLVPPREIDRFVVRRFDSSVNTWVKVNTLGNRTVFVDLSWGIVSPEKTPINWGCKGDCIYFVDPMRNTLRLFSIKDGKMEDLLSFVSSSHDSSSSSSFCCDNTKFRWDLSVWVIPSLIC